MAAWVEEDLCPQVELSLEKRCLSVLILCTIGGGEVPEQLLERWLFCFRSLHWPFWHLNLHSWITQASFVSYYIYIRPQPLFEISSISANIFSFSFSELNAD